MALAHDIRPCFGSLCNFIQSVCEDGYGIPVELGHYDWKRNADNKEMCSFSTMDSTTDLSLKNDLLIFEQPSC